MQQAVLGSSTSQKISCIHYSVHVTPILTTILSRVNSTHHTFPSYFLKIHFNIILSAMSSSSKWSLFLQVFWTKLCPVLHTYKKTTCLSPLYLKLNNVIVSYCPTNMTKHLLCINKAPIHVQSYCAIRLK